MNARDDFISGNSFKYHWRYQQKNGLEDLRKKAWHDKKLLRLEEVIYGYVKRD